jgi:hypothetical protein
LSGRSSPLVSQEFGKRHANTHPRDKVELQMPRLSLDDGYSQKYALHGLNRLSHYAPLGSIKTDTDLLDKLMSESIQYALIDSHPHHS